MILSLLAFLFRIECWFYGIDISTDKAKYAIKTEGDTWIIQRESEWRR
jgi:hypothetical protein